MQRDNWKHCGGNLFPLCGREFKSSTNQRNQFFQGWFWHLLLYCCEKSLIFVILSNMFDFTSFMFQTLFSGIKLNNTPPHHHEGQIGTQDLQTQNYLHPDSVEIALFLPSITLEPSYLLVECFSSWAAIKNLSNIGLPCLTWSIPF